MCFCNAINIYRYVYNYAWKTMIIPKCYDIFEFILSFLLVSIIPYIYILSNFIQYLMKNNQKYSLDSTNISINFYHFILNQWHWKEIWYSIGFLHWFDMLFLYIRNLILYNGAWNLTHCGNETEIAI